VSMMDIVEEMNWAFNGEDPVYRRLPDDDRVLSQLLLFYDGKDLHELVNREFQTARIVLSANVHGANAIGEVIDAIRVRLNEFPIAGVSADIGGYGRLFADHGDLLVTGQINSFFGAFAQIFVLLLILWRSLAASVITLLPNLAPLYFIFVWMGSRPSPWIWRPRSSPGWCWALPSTTPSTCITTTSGAAGRGGAGSSPWPGASRRRGGRWSRFRCCSLPNSRC